MIEHGEAGGCRHSPIVDYGALIGIVLIRGIYASIRAELEHAVFDCEAFLSGAGGDQP